MLAPLGGPKGFALAFLLEALTCGLVGPALSAEVSDVEVSDVEGADPFAPRRLTDDRHEFKCQ